MYEITKSVSAFGVCVDHGGHHCSRVCFLLLGFVAYGQSIYCYTYAQRTIGAALSFLLIGEPLTPLFLVATAVMAAGCWLAAKSN